MLKLLPSNAMWLRRIAEQEAAKQILESLSL
jgi:hypothetical protein